MLSAWYDNDLSLQCGNNLEMRILKWIKRTAEDEQLRFLHDLHYIIKASSGMLKYSSQEASDSGQFQEIANLRLERAPWVRIPPPPQCLKNAESILQTLLDKGIRVYTNPTASVSDNEHLPNTRNGCTASAVIYSSRLMTTKSVRFRISSSCIFATFP